MWPLAIKTIDYERCTDCGICYKICPMDVFDRVGRLVYLARVEDCMTCFLCELDCPVDCIYVAPERERDIVLPFEHVGHT